MSTSFPPSGQTQAAGAGGADPSMEDILASIRRILSEDEAEQPAAAPPAKPGPASDVLALDASMLVEESAAGAAPPPPPPAPISTMPALIETQPVEPEQAGAAADSLLGPEATAAAASSVGNLLRTLVSERQHVAVYRGGPTIEDLVREEIRPLLKHWLDTNLPPLVERLVRAEIERVVLRAVT
jgi:cell pole-organizing protein PopZ